VIDNSLVKIRDAKSKSLTRESAFKACSVVSKINRTFLKAMGSSSFVREEETFDCNASSDQLVVPSDE